MRQRYRNLSALDQNEAMEIMLERSKTQARLRAVLIWFIIGLILGLYLKS